MDAEYTVDATFTGIAGTATTDVHVLHNGRSIHDGLINVAGHGNELLHRGLQGPGPLPGTLWTILHNVLPEKGNLPTTPMANENGRSIRPGR